MVHGCKSILDLITTSQRAHVSMKCGESDNSTVRGMPPPSQQQKVDNYTQSPLDVSATHMNNIDCSVQDYSNSLDNALLH